MYLFTRRATLAGGRSRDTYEWSLDITERVHRLTGLDVSLYSQVFCAGVGTTVWSTFVPDLQTLEAGFDKLGVDDGFLEASDKGAAFVKGNIDDSLHQVIYGQPDPTRQVEYVGVVRAVCASGQLARGMEIAVEVAQRAEKLTGHPTLAVADSTGSYGGVGWITPYGNIRDLEAGGQALADPSFVEFLDTNVSAVYLPDPNITAQTIYRRIG